MDKHSIKNFIARLELSSIEEIRQHQAFILESLPDIRTREGKADARLALRLIDEELISRLGLADQR